MVLHCDEAQVEAHFGLSGDSANHDARQVNGLPPRTIGSEIFLDAPDRTPGCLGHVKSSFSPFRCGVSVGAR
jgi:hypothetical protein